MQNNTQRKFILTPIVEILQDTVNACKGISKGIETQSLGEYVLQTTFLKMTGAQEQKLKSICWEMATNDYGYRYKYLNKNYGECSSYVDKNNIYKDMVEMISKMEKGFTVATMFDDVNITLKLGELIQQKVRETIQKHEKQKGRKLTDEEKERMTAGMTTFYNRKGLCGKERSSFCRRVVFEEVQEKIDKIVGNSLVTQWEEHSYLNYMEKWNTLSKWSFAIDGMLLSKELQDFYKSVVYDHRNKCAHNLVSVHKNLPTLKTMEEEDYVYDNYYFRFSVLVLLDDIFVRLYMKYLEGLTKTVENILT